MPTATNYFDVAVANLGPLTTTWTAPASCATDTGGWYLTALDPDSDRAFVGAKLSCESDGKSVTVDDCYPSNQVAAQQWSTQSGGLFNQYFSPGLHCPSGWTTAGTVVKASSGLTGASGVFTKSSNSTTRDPYSDWPVAFLDATRVYEGILEPSETLAWCCPSGFKVDVGGFCSSIVGPAASHSVTGYCRKYIEVEPVTTVSSYDGQIYTNGLESFAKTGGTSKTYENTFAATEIEGIAVVTGIPVVALIHKGSDHDSDQGSGHDSAAGGVQPGFGKISVTPLVALAAGILAGAGLILPW